MNTHELQLRPLIAVGLVSGLVQVAAGVAMYLAGVYFAVWSGPLSLLLLAVCIAGGTWWYVTRVLGGRSTYLTALLVGIGIAVSTAVVYVAYNLVSISLVYPHFLEDMAQARFARRQALGLDPSQAGQVLESVRAQTTLWTVVVGNLTFLCVRGAVVAALAALVFRKGSGGVGVH
jgi:hypothetical protein